MSAALEHFVNEVCTLSAQGNYSELSEIVNKSTEVLMKSGQHLDNVLETFNLQQHSLGYLAVLEAKLSLPSPGANDNRIQLAEEFINGCNGEQIRFAAEKFAHFCHLFTNRYIEIDQPIRGIPIMLKAIHKAQLHVNQLTSIHADLCQLCLLSKCFKPAVPLLDSDITSINQEGPELFDTKYFLLYYYYGGMIYTALKNYDRALYFYEVAVTTPATRAVSHIMLEAYKKYILVSLILHGKVPTNSKYTSKVVGRFMKPLSQPYCDLASAYQTQGSNIDELRSIISKYQDIFIREQNYGLVKQVLASLYKKNIQRLTKTFLTLSLTDVASKVQLPGPSEAEKYILNMIEDGDIYATINQKDGMVVFHEAPEKYDSPETLKNLEQRMAETAALAKQVQAMENEISTNPVYIQKTYGITQGDSQDATAGPTASYIRRLNKYLKAFVD